jgi:hypothetical protein
MAKPPFSPTPDQTQVLDQLTRLARQRTQLDEETDRALADARALGIPYRTIGHAYGIDWETAKRRLTKTTAREATP